MAKWSAIFSCWDLQPIQWQQPRHILRPTVQSESTGTFTPPRPPYRPLPLSTTGPGQEVVSPVWVWRFAFHHDRRPRGVDCVFRQVPPRSLWLDEEPSVALVPYDHLCICARCVHALQKPWCPLSDAVPTSQSKLKKKKFALLYATIIWTYWQFSL